jgi:aldose 1-epimerase
VQFYSGNYLKGDLVGKGGHRYAKHAGLCLETQAFPNSINVPEWEGQVTLLPDQTYKHVMVHKFTAD